jgi:hypothetical protein
MCDFEVRSETIRSAIQRVITEVEKSAKAKATPSKMNEKGIAMVDAARFIWRLSTDTSAPLKDLNPASKFSNFLADVLYVCEIPGDPRSIFRAWVREYGEWSIDYPN